MKKPIKLGYIDRDQYFVQFIFSVPYKLVVQCSIQTFSIADLHIFFNIFIKTCFIVFYFNLTIR